MVLRNRNEVEDDLSDEGRQSPNGYRAREDRYQRMLEELMIYFSDQAHESLDRMYSTGSELIAHFRVKETATAICNGLRKYPLLALSVAAVIFIVSLPFILFMLFTLTTAVMTFTGFVLIEGSLITVASMLMIAVLIGVGCMLGSIGLFFLLGYFGLSKAYDCYGRWWNDQRLRMLGPRPGEQNGY